MINNRMNRMRQTLYNPENGNMGQQMPQIPPTPNNNVRAMQKKLQKISFALVELVLYLDAYPNCEKAKKYYKELMAERDALVKSLAEAGFPVSAMNSQSSEWVWTKGPWPWEYEANV